MTIGKIKGSPMNNRERYLEKLRSCYGDVQSLFLTINKYIETGKNKINIANRLSAFDYSILNLLDEIFPNEVEEIMEEAQLSRTDHYLRRGLKKLDDVRDRGVFWIKCGEAGETSHFVGYEDDYKIIGDLILNRMDESDDNNGQLMDKIVSYVNDRMATDD